MRGDTAWFHEDDYCQIELLARDAQEFAKQQASDINMFSAAHEVPGVGWTEMYMRPDPPISLAMLKITLADFDDQALHHFRRFQNVTTGYSTHVEAAGRTLAWGVGNEPLLFADFDTDGVISHVWFSFPSAPYLEPLRLFLHRCVQRWPLILADWAWSSIVDLRDDDAVLTYLEQRTGVRPT